MPAAASQSDSAGEAPCSTARFGTGWKTPHAPGGGEPPRRGNDVLRWGIRSRAAERLRPTDRAEPVEPIDSSDSLEQMLRRLLREATDQRVVVDRSCRGSGRVWQTGRVQHRTRIIIS